MKYSASYDSTVKVITAIITAAMPATAVYSCYGIMYSESDIHNQAAKVIICMGIILLMALVPLICYIYSPQYYELKDGNLIIKRVTKDRIIKLEDIAGARLLERPELKGLIRTFGVGGVFGYFGRFANKKLGSMTFYATQNKNWIFIQLKKGQKVVITPDDPGLLKGLPTKPI